MKTLAQKYARILGLFSIGLMIIGTVFLSIITILVGLVLCLGSKSVAAPDIELVTPAAQYWFRNLVLKSLLIFLAGFSFGGVLSAFGITVSFMDAPEIIYGLLMLALLLIAFRRTLPELLESSWRLWSLTARPDESEESSFDIHWASFIVKSTAACLFVASSLAGTALLSTGSFPWDLMTVAFAG